MVLVSTSDEDRILERLIFTEGVLWHTVAL